MAGQLSTENGRTRLGINDLLQWWLEKSPEAQEIVRQAEEETLAGRRAMFKRWTEASLELEREVARLEKEVTQGKAKVDAARGSLRAAEVGLAKSDRELRLVRARKERDMAVEERSLRITADPCIDDFVAAVARYRDTHCNTRTVVVSEVITGYKLVGGAEITEKETNRALITAWSLACLAAMRAAEALKLEAIAETDARLAEIAASIPVEGTGIPPFTWERQ
jgi:hypothetical protein